METHTDKIEEANRALDRLELEIRGFSSGEDRFAEIRERAQSLLSMCYLMAALISEKTYRLFYTGPTV